MVAALSSPSASRTMKLAHRVSPLQRNKKIDVCLCVYVCVSVCVCVCVCVCVHSRPLVNGFSAVSVTDPSRREACHATSALKSDANP